jgi:hypothetical protein
MSNEGQSSHNRESLINRKRTNFFSFRLQFGRGQVRLFDISGPEKAVGGILRGALFNFGGAETFNLRRQERDALAEFVHRKQREILTDLVSDLFPRLIIVVVLARHRCCSGSIIRPSRRLFAPNVKKRYRLVKPH